MPMSKLTLETSDGVKRSWFLEDIVISENREAIPVFDDPGSKKISRLEAGPIRFNISGRLVEG